MKKILCLALAFVLLTGALPAFADGEKPFLVTIEGTKVTIELAENTEPSDRIDIKSYGVDENSEIDTLVIGVRNRHSCNRRGNRGTQRIYRL